MSFQGFYYEVNFLFFKYMVILLNPSNMVILIQILFNKIDKNKIVEMKI